MRKLLRSLPGGESDSDRLDVARGRPESLRRKTIATNSVFTLAVSMLARWVVNRRADFSGAN